MRKYVGILFFLYDYETLKKTLAGVGGGGGVFGPHPLATWVIIFHLIRTVDRNGRYIDVLGTRHIRRPHWGGENI